MSPQRISKFQTSRTGRAMYGIVALIAAYAFGSLAINSGSLWEWALAIILLIVGIQNLGRFIGSFIHGKN